MDGRNLTGTGADFPCGAHELPKFKDAIVGRARVTESSNKDRIVRIINDRASHLTQVDEMLPGTFTEG